MNKDSCPICNGTGYKLDGTSCTCKSFDNLLDLIPSNLDYIPVSYRGVKYLPSIPNDTKAAQRLMEVMDETLNEKLCQHFNVFLYTPKDTGKTIIAYNIIEYLNSFGKETYPYFDLEELNAIISAIDKGNTNIPYSYPGLDMLSLFSVPVLVCKVPDSPSWYSYKAFNVIADRRSRRGLKTLFLSSIPFKEFKENCKSENLLDSTTSILSPRNIYVIEES